MSQSKAMSLVEAITNTLVGLALAFAVNAALMHWTGVTATAMQNFLIVAGHTVVSVLRSYVIRRMFNRYPELVRVPYCKRCNSADMLRAQFDEECG